MGRAKIDLFLNITERHIKHIGKIAMSEVSPADRRPPKLGPAYLGVVVLIEACLLVLLRVPSSYRFVNFAFLDNGADLAIQYLTQHGDRLYQDNGYYYGLLPLALGKLLYGALGRRPLAFEVAAIVATLVVAANLARYCSLARSDWKGESLLILTLPFVLTVGYPSITHMLEAVIITFALCEHLAGKRPAALALLTACLFVKPAMAYVYGLLLTILIIRRELAVPGKPIIQSLRPLFPSACVAIVLSLGLGSAYGTRPLFHSLLPFSGARIYHANHYGFIFGKGQDFWWPRGASAGYYFGTVVGFWLAASVALILGSAAAVAVAMRGWTKSIDLTGRVEAASACAVLHLVFVLVFFGNAWSWSYYFYLLPMGLIALIPFAPGRFPILASCLLLPLAFGGLRSSILPGVHEWQNYRRGPETAGLFAAPDERDEWIQVQKFLAGRTSSFLALSDGAGSFLPGVEPPTLWFLVRGGTKPREITRKVQELANAMFIVETRIDGPWPSDLFQEFLEPLSSCERVLDTRFYRVHQRVESTPSSPQSSAH